jgi:glycosyltransferase involved in cell wall biosynthesis
MSSTARGERDSKRDDEAAPALSIILCVRNGASTVRGQLRALAAQEWDEPWDVVVVDNGSTDDTLDVIEHFAASNPRFRVVRATEKHGLSYARNVGVANTDAAAVAFVDDDDIVTFGWVAAMGGALREHPIVACRFDWSQRHVEADQRTLAGGAFQRDGIEEVFGYPVVAGVSGWQRWLWQDLGGNDETLTFTGEDFDMAIRAHINYGIAPYFEPDAIYRITRRAGFRSNFRQARRYGRASTVLYMRYGRGRTDRRAELRRSLKSWLWLATHVFTLRRPDGAIVWARLAGTRCGRLEQSIRSRTLWL